MTIRVPAIMMTKAIKNRGLGISRKMTNDSATPIKGAMTYKELFLCKLISCTLAFADSDQHSALHQSFQDSGSG